MGNAPVFGRRGTSSTPDRLPTLAQLAPTDSDSNADQLAAWKRERGDRYWRSFLGWKGAGLVLTLASLGLMLIDLNLLALPLMFGGVGCFVMSVRRGER